MESADLHTSTHCSSTVQIPINTDKLGYLPATQRNGCACQSPERISPISNISLKFPSCLPPGHTDMMGHVGTTFWTCKFIAVRLLGFSAHPHSPSVIPFPKLGILGLEVGEGRVAGRRRNPLLSTNALCSKRQTQPRAQCGASPALEAAYWVVSSLGLGSGGQWSRVLLPAPSKLQPRYLTSFHKPFPPNEREEGERKEGVEGDDCTLEKNT